MKISIIKNLKNKKNRMKLYAYSLIGTMTVLSFTCASGKKIDFKPEIKESTEKILVIKRKGKY